MDTFFTASPTFLKKGCPKAAVLSFEYSISRVLFRKAVPTIYLGVQLPASSSDTTREAQRAASSLPYLVLLRMGFT